MRNTTLPGIPVKITRAEIERHLVGLKLGNPLTPSDPWRGWTGKRQAPALAGIRDFAAFLH
jgi:hypothetical protein